MPYIIKDNYTDQTISKFRPSAKGDERFEWGDNYSDFWDTDCEGWFMPNSVELFPNLRSAKRCEKMLKEAFRNDGTCEDEIDFSIIKVRERIVRFYEMV